MFAALLSASLLAPAAPVPKELARPKDVAAIQGTWKVTSSDSGAGWDILAKLCPGLLYDFVGDTLTGRWTGEKGKTSRTTWYNLDPSAQPKAIDLIGHDGLSQAGLYELNGDDLKLCMHAAEKPVRPTLFRPDRQSDLIVITMKRVKAEK